MQIISNMALISINETLIIQVISFLVFLFLINRLMFRPLKKTMTARDQHIEGIKHDIVAAKNHYDQITNQIKDQDSALRKEATALRETLEASAGQQADEIFTSVRKEIADQSAKAKQDISARVVEARKKLQKESEDLALNMMEKILDRRLQP